MVKILIGRVNRKIEVFQTFSVNEVEKMVPNKNLSKLFLFFEAQYSPKRWCGALKKSFDFAVEYHASSSHVIGPRDKINKAVHITGGENGSK